MIRQAHEIDMLTTPYVFSADEAIEMTKAGADLIVPHMGVTTGGTIGASTSKSLEQSVKLIDEWAEAARRVRKDVIVIAHGGPISSPADVDLRSEAQRPLQRLLWGQQRRAASGGRGHRQAHPDVQEI